MKKKREPVGWDRDPAVHRHYIPHGKSWEVPSNFYDAHSKFGSRDNPHCHKNTKPQRLDLEDKNP